MLSVLYNCMAVCFITIKKFWSVTHKHVLAGCYGKTVCRTQSSTYSNNERVFLWD